MNKINQTKWQKESRRRQEESLMFILEDDRGRYFISEMLNAFCFAEMGAYTNDSKTYYNLGRQDVYAQLKANIEHILGINGFNLWQKMEKEKFERRLEQREQQ